MNKYITYQQVWDFLFLYLNIRYNQLMSIFVTGVICKHIRNLKTWGKLAYVHVYTLLKTKPAISGHT